MGEVPLYTLKHAPHTRGGRSWSSSSSLLLSSLELSDTKTYEPQIRALLGTASHFCEVVVLKLRTGLQIVVWGIGTALGELPPYLVSFSASVSGEKVPRRARI